MTLTGENKPDIAKAVAYLGNAQLAIDGDDCSNIPWEHFPGFHFYLASLEILKHCLDHLRAAFFGKVISAAHIDPPSFS